jgi:drug/metabolite transporter (DMT)-like permease
MMNDQTRGALEMTAAMAISGTIGWFVLEAGRPVVEVVFWRCLFGAVVLAAACATLGLFRGLTWRTIGMAALGGLALVANWVLLFQSYKHASIAVATTIYNTQPFMLIVLGAVFFAEKLTATKVAWLAIAFAGVLLIAQTKVGGGAGGRYGLGIAMALGAAFFYAVASITTKLLKGTPPHLIALIQVGVGLAVMAPFIQSDALPTDSRTWSLLIAIGAIHTGLVYILLYGAIQKLPTHITGALSFIYPVVAIAADFLAYGRRLEAAQMAGCAMIMTAAAGMTLGWRLWKARQAQNGTI